MLEIMSEPTILQVINYIDEWSDELGYSYKKDCYKIISPNGSIIYYCDQDYIKCYDEYNQNKRKQTMLKYIINQTLDKIKSTHNTKIESNIQFINMNGTIINI